MNLLAQVRDHEYPMGFCGGNQPQPFCLSMDLLAVHMAVLGGSGSGKSKFLELLCRHLLLRGEGGLFIDPHGDTAADLAAFLLHQVAVGNPAPFRKTHFLEVAKDRTFSFDPFRRLPARSTVPPHHYYDLLSAKVDRMCRTILRNVAEADMEVMNRLKRWLKNVLFCCGVDFSGNGHHVGLQRALVFTDPQHPEFSLLLQRVFPVLPDFVQSDMHKLQSTKRPLDQERWVESTVNRLRDILRPSVGSIFTPRADSFDMARAIRESEFVIASMQQSPWWSHDQKVILSGFLIDEVLDIKEAEDQVLPPEQRKRFAMILDECGELIGDDLKRALGAVRKYRLPLVLAAQNLTKFCKGTLDMATEVMAQCQVKVIFQQQEDENLMMIVRCIGHGNLDLEERIVEVQRQRGWIEREMEEHSKGTSRGYNLSRGTSSTKGSSEQFNQSYQSSDTTGGSVTTGRSSSEQSGWSSGNTRSSGSSESETRVPILKGDEVIGFSSTMSESEQDSTSRQNSLSGGESKSRSQSTARNHSHTSGSSSGKSTGTSKQEGSSLNAGITGGESHTVSYKTQILANIVSEYEANGQLAAGPLDVQWEALAQLIHGLATGECVVKLPAVRAAFPVKVAWLQDEWVDGAKWQAIQIAKQKLAAQRAHTFQTGAVLPPGGSSVPLQPASHPTRAVAPTGVPPAPQQPPSHAPNPGTGVPPATKNRAGQNQPSPFDD